MNIRFEMSWLIFGFLKNELRISRITTGIARIKKFLRPEML